MLWEVMDQPRRLHRTRSSTHNKKKRKVHSRLIGGEYWCLNNKQRKKLNKHNKKNQTGREKGVLTEIKARESFKEKMGNRVKCCRMMRIQVLSKSCFRNSGERCQFAVGEALWEVREWRHQGLSVCQSSWRWRDTRRHLEEDRSQGRYFKWE